MDIIFSKDQLPQTVKTFWEEYGRRSIFSFSGQMGAGKTTFIHELASYLGVHDTVSSPTYSIINHYVTAEGKDLYHMDLYRLRGKEEALDLGIEDIVTGDAICLIEWPEIIASFLPENTVSVTLIVVSDYERRLKVVEAG